MHNECHSLGAVYYLFTAYTERAFLHPFRLFKQPLSIADFSRFHSSKTELIWDTLCHLWDYQLKSLKVLSFLILADLASSFLSTCEKCRFNVAHKDRIIAFLVVDNQAKRRVIEKTGKKFQKQIHIFNRAWLVVSTKLRLYYWQSDTLRLLVGQA